MNKPFNNVSKVSQPSKITFKQCLFTLIFQLLKFRSDSRIAFFFLVTIDLYQHLWYVVSPALSGSDHPFQWYQTALRYLQLDHAFEQENKTLLITLLYFVFGWQIIYFGTITFCTWKLRRLNNKSTKIIDRLFKFISMSTMIMNSFICLPIFQIYLTIIICNKGNPIYGSLTCYQGQHFIHLFVALFGFFIHLSSNLIFGLFYRDYNPFTSAIIGGPLERTYMFRQGLKFLLPFYTLITFSVNWKAAGVILYGIYMIGLLILRYRQNPFYKKRWFQIIVGSEALVLWAIIVQLMHLAVDTSTQGRIMSIFFFICSPIVIFGIIRIVESRYKKIKFMNIQSLPRDVDVELYINIVLSLIRNRRQKISLMELEGFVKYHTKYCTNINCPCPRLLKPAEPNYEPKKEDWYLWVQSLLKEGIQKFPKSALLHLQLAFVFDEKLHNKFKALYELDSFKSLKHSIEQESVAFRLKASIERQIIDEDQKFAESSGLDFKQAYLYYQKFLIFEDLIGEATSLQVDFWNELIQKDPKPQILERVGIKVVNLWEKIGKLYKKLLNMNSNNIPTLQLYGDFLKNVANDPAESTKVIDKIENAATTTNIKQQLNETDEHQDYEEYQKSMMMYYGEWKRLGDFKDITPEITKLLGYSRNEMIGENLNLITPRIYQGNLKEILFDTLMESEEKTTLNKNIILFFRNKDGYLILCSLMPYLVPSLNDGLLFVNFVRKVDDEEEPFPKFKLPYFPGSPHYIIWNTQTYAIHGLTKNCWTSFGIPSSLVDDMETEGEFLITDVFPDFDNLDQDHMKGSKGVATMLDTTGLDQKFLLRRHNHSHSDISSENTENQINNRKRVPVYLSAVEDPFVCGPNIQYLRIVEQETEDMDSPVKVVPQDNYISLGRNGADDFESRLDYDQSINSDVNLGSNIFSLDSINDDVKIMREFRHMLAKRNMTWSIKRLLIGIIWFFAVLIGMQSYEYSMMSTQITEVTSGFNDISLAFLRFSNLADLTFFIRELQFLAYVPTSVYIPLLRAGIPTLIIGLENTQYKLSSAIYELRDTKFVSIDHNDFTFEQSQEQVVTSQKLLYVDGLFKYITAATRVRNAPLASFLSSQNPLDSTVDSLYMIRRNGYGPLRNGSEQTITNFNDYHSDRLDSYGKKYLIVLIVLLVILIGAIAAISFLVFSIEDKKAFIISLFGHIPLEEVEEMLEQCQDFGDRYLQGVLSYEHERSFSPSQNNSQSFQPQNFSKADQHNHSLNDLTFKAERSPEESGMLSVSENTKAAPIAQFQLTPRDTRYVPLSMNRSAGDPESQGNSMITAPVTLRLPQDSYNQNLLTSSYMLGTETKRPLQYSAREGTHTERTVGGFQTLPKETNKFTMMEELGEERAQQMFRVKKNETKSFTKFTIAGSIFWSLVFILQYFLFEKWFIDKTTIIYRHLNLTFGRMAYLKYVTAFLMEEVSLVTEQATYSLPGQQGVINLRLRYAKLCEAYNQEISSAAKAGLPRAFNDYLGKFVEINTGNVCAYYYDTPTDIKKCEDNVNLKVNNGLSLAITSTLNDIETVIKTFQADVAAITTTNTTQRRIEIGTAQFKALATNEYISSTTTSYFLGPLLAQLKDAYSVAFGKFVNFTTNTVKIIYGSFIGFCMVLIVVWLLYVKDVDYRLRRTRSILNMIPVETLATNESIKNAVLSSNFQTVLK